MKLKDQDTGEELHFDYNDWVESTNENPEGAVELPAIRPDLHPVTGETYTDPPTQPPILYSRTQKNIYCV